MGQYGNAWKQQMQREENNSNSTSSKNVLRPAYVKDEDGVWRCSNCLDEDERDFGAFRALKPFYFQLFQAIIRFSGDGCVGRDGCAPTASRPKALSRYR